MEINMPYFYYDWTIILLIPAIIFVSWAQINVSSTYKKYSKIQTKRGMTGYDAARAILDANGLSYVRIEPIKGELTDHFDPRDNVIRLSEVVYDKASAAAVGVAAHEAGHAVQYAEGYVPMKIRSAIIPATNFGSKLAIPLVLLGVILSFPLVAFIGVILFSLSTVFQLVTLPVEFNASSRAMAALSGGGELDTEELSSAKKVLRAAALTYVGALAMSLLNLLRVILIAGRSRRN